MSGERIGKIVHIAFQFPQEFHQCPEMAAPIFPRQIDHRRCAYLLQSFVYQSFLKVTGDVAVLG